MARQTAVGAAVVAVTLMLKNLPDDVRTRAHDALHNMRLFACLTCASVLRQMSGRLRVK